MIDKLFISLFILYQILATKNDLTSTILCRLFNQYNMMDVMENSYISNKNIIKCIFVNINWWYYDSYQVTSSIAYFFNLINYHDVISSINFFLSIYSTVIKWFHLNIVYFLIYSTIITCFHLRSSVCCLNLSV